MKKIICPFFSKYVIVDFFHFLANEGPSGTDFGGAKIGDTPLPQWGVKLGVKNLGAENVDFNTLWVTFLQRGTENVDFSTL